MLATIPVDRSLVLNFHLYLFSIGGSCYSCFGVQFLSQHMESGDHNPIQAIFLSALNIAPSDREEWLSQRCRGDTGLLREVQSLLEHDSAAHGIFGSGLDCKAFISEESTQREADLRVRCPHCREQLFVPDEAALGRMTCRSCGSDICLVGEDPTQSQRDLPKTTVGHLTLVAEVGRGAFGSVFRARDPSLDRIVAVKVPRKDQLTAIEASQFLREARTAAQLRHPNIVSVHEVGREGDRVFIVSDFIDGLTLSDWLSGAKPSSREAAFLLIKIARALHYAHERGVIHRDLKPGNIMLDRTNEPFIMDFGLAKRESGEVTMTIDGQVLGTPAYMSPEQAQGNAHQVDRRSDIYALGVILFEMLTGERPFRGNTQMLLHQLITEEAPSPRRYNASIPKDLETICLKCLEKAPQKRYVSAGELADDLQRYLDHRPIDARSIGPVERGWRWCKRKPLVASMAAGIVLLLSAIGVVSTAGYISTLAALQREEDALAIVTFESNRAQREAVRAESAFANAESERVRAEANLVDLYEFVGAASATDRKYADSLLWFAKASEAGERDPMRSQLNRLRFRNWMREVPSPIHAFRNELGRTVALEFNPAGTHVLVHTTHGVVIWNLVSDQRTAHPGGRAAFSHAGELVAIGGKDEVKILSLSDSSVKAKVPVRGEDISAVAFNHEDNQLAIAAQELRIWDFERSTFINGVAPHPARIEAVFFSPDDRNVISCTTREARVFDLSQDKLKAEPKFPPVSHKTEGGVGHPRMLPLPLSETHMLFRSRPTRLDAVDVRSGSVDREFILSSGRLVANAAVSPEYQRLVLAADPTGELECFNTATAESIARFTPSVDRCPGLAFQPGTPILATASHDSSLRFFDMETQFPVWSSIKNQGQCEIVTFSADGKLLATVQSDETVKVFQSPHSTTGLQAKIDNQQSWLPHEPTLSADGKLLVTAGARWDRAPQKATVYDPDTGIPIGPTIDVKGELTATAISRDGTRVALLSAASGTTAPSQNGNLGSYLNHPGQITLWDWRCNKRSMPIATQTLPIDAAFSPDGSRLIVLCGRGEILVIDPHRQQIVKTARHQGSATYGYNHRSRMIRFSPAGDTFCTFGVNNSVRIWSTDVSLVHEFKDNARTRDATYSPDGRFVAIAAANGQVNVIETTTGKLAGPTLRHPTFVWHVCFNESGDQLATACEDKMARVWRWRDGTLVSPGMEHPYPVRGVFFSQKDRFLIAATSKQVHFWEVASARQIAPARHCDTNESIPSFNAAQDIIVAYDKVLFLDEYQMPSEPSFTSSERRGIAEVLSARRIEQSGSTILTGNEWLQRFIQLKKADLVRGSSNSQNRRQDPLIRILTTLVRNEEWNSALEFAQATGTTPPDDPYTLALLAEIYGVTGGRDKTKSLLDQLARLAEGREIRTAFTPLSALFSRPETNDAAESFIRTLQRSNVLDNRLLGLHLLDSASQDMEHHMPLLSAAWMDADSDVSDLALRILAERAHAYSQKEFEAAIGNLEPSMQSRLRLEIKSRVPHYRITEPEIRALIGTDDAYRWSELKPLAGAINTRAPENTGFLSEDGLRFYFTSGRENGMGYRDLWVGHRNTVGEQFKRIANLGKQANSSATEIEATLTSDELIVAFASDREGGRGQRDIWFSTRDSTDLPFGTPINAGPKINSSNFETAPSLSEDGLTLAFASRKDGDQEIYIARRASRDVPFENVKRLGFPVNSARLEDNPSLLQNGKYLVYRAQTADGVSAENFDLFLSVFSPETSTFEGRYLLIDSLQSGSIDCAPKVFGGHRVLFMASSRPGGQHEQDPRSWSALDIWYSELVEK